MIHRELLNCLQAGFSDEYLAQLFADDLDIEAPASSNSVVDIALANILANVRSTAEGRRRLSQSIYVDSYHKARENARDAFSHLICNSKELNLPIELTRLVPDIEGKMVPNAFKILGKEYPTPSYVLLWLFSLFLIATDLFLL